MYNNLNKGFTLIELLTVIAIIGILSSIVLSSLGTAKNKGANSTIKSNLNQLRAQGSLYIDTPSALGGATTADTYAGLCAGVQSLSVRFVDVIKKAHESSSAPSANIRYTSSYNQVLNPTYTVCHNDNTGWAVSVPLKVDEGLNKFFCVDHKGFSGVRQTGLGDSIVVCPAS